MSPRPRRLPRPRRFSTFAAAWTFLNECGLEVAAYRGHRWRVEHDPDTGLVHVMPTHRPRRT